MKKFDLNIEKILENWETKHAVREIIANALDEQLLTNTSEIQIYYSYETDTWIIKDFGRGLKYDHFTQKENDEKLNTSGIIGKFGIGLKDALATLERKNIGVKILSKFGDITLGKSQKNGFDDLLTLHANISEATDKDMVGTEFHLSNIKSSEIHEAKKLFLKFNNELIMEHTSYGCVLQKDGSHGNIYINGVLVATEDNFLFSYNITLLNANIKKAINRERTNVGRAAYSNSVKSILLECQSEKIGIELSEDLSRFSDGSNHDELKWIDVQEHAAKILNKYKKVVFVTPTEIEFKTDLINEARNGGAEIVVIPASLQVKIAVGNMNEDENDRIKTLKEFARERSKNFQFKIVSDNDLSYSEKQVLSKVNQVFSILGGKPDKIKTIEISETMQEDTVTFMQAAAVWMPVSQKIIVWRPILKSEQEFLGVLLHEIAHAISGATDATRVFEKELTRLLGLFSKAAISIHKYDDYSCFE